jgi:hypothetical protein
MSGRHRASAGRILAGVVDCCLLFLLSTPLLPSGDGTEPSTDERPELAPSCRTLEDFYGDTGQFFQGGLGLLNFESQDQNQSDVGFGLTVDDHVIEWREFRLVNDASDCVAGGHCAVVDMSTLISYEGNTLLTISAFDDTFPWGNPPGFNNCAADSVCDDGSTVCEDRLRRLLARLVHGLRVGRPRRRRVRRARPGEHLRGGHDDLHRGPDGSGGRRPGL